MKKLYFLLSTFMLFGFLSAQTIYIPNAIFKSMLTAQSTVYARDINGNGMIVDTNNDGEIQVSEAHNVYKLYVGGAYDNDLTGIEYFINVTELWCGSNTMASLDLSTLSHLKTLRCSHSQLQNLNISGLTELIDVMVDYNLLTNLNLTGCTALERLWCNNNLLNTIDISALSNLDDFRCQNNTITTLNASNLTHLNQLECANNHMTSLDVSGSVNLQVLNCSDNQLSGINVSQSVHLNDIRLANNPISTINLTGLNQITWIDLSGTPISSMDFSQMPFLQFIICNTCSLTTIDASDNHNIGEIHCLNCPVLESVFMKNGKSNALIASGPELKYVCADDIEMDIYHMNIPTNTVVNSYCTFTPGGLFHIVQGSSKFDMNTNGCDITDGFFPNLNLSITNGTDIGTIISDNSGNYTLPIQDGTYSITPVLENPAYFNISPATVSFTFPTQASPFTQNFCVTANGSHPDLEVTILPITPARPGFDAIYKIIYKNKGNITQSGSVNIVFNDAVLDFVSASPVTSGQSLNNLSWNFANLLPLESREITLTLNVNTPSDSPSVNGGDILNYIITVASAASDDTPGDNTFLYNQTVVNSFDPNDKTCIEGATIIPARVGDYVHYMIRFENTGTFPAENIVVKDLIDTTKFDISTLVPIKGSHSFVTNIAADNKVEFIFKGINLPFDNANNDGFVAFKIKTKPTLVLGDTFSNTASIYFDYNLPIVTNTAMTTIAFLATQDFVFSNYFRVYPNPVNDILNITAKEAIQISSINIYNTLAQLVLVIPNAQTTRAVDVSALIAGNYFIKINSNKGTSNTKFIKN